MGRASIRRPESGSEPDPQQVLFSADRLINPRKIHSNLRIGFITSGSRIVGGKTSATTPDTATAAVNLRPIQ